MNKKDVLKKILQMEFIVALQPSSTTEYIDGVKELWDLNNPGVDETKKAVVAGIIFQTGISKVFLETITEQLEELKAIVNEGGEDAI